MSPVTMYTFSCLQEDNKIIISGDLNFQTVHQIWHQSLTALNHQSSYCIDLSQVTSANSAAVALLIEWWKWAKQQNKAIQFNHIPDTVLSIIKVAKLDQFFE